MLFKRSDMRLRAEFCQGLQAGTQLQLHVSVHDADWDPDQYMADLAAAAAQATAQGQQGGLDDLVEVRSNAEALYHLQGAAVLYKSKNSWNYRFKQLQHDHKLDVYLGSLQYEVVLQEKVRQEHFCLAKFKQTA